MPAPVRQSLIMAAFERDSFISIGDLVQGRLDEIQREASAMRAYIQTA